MTRVPFVVSLVVGIAIGLAGAGNLRAQRGGDYMTEDELDLVRDTRAIDHRSVIFMKVAERRINALASPEGGTLDTKAETFGPLPKGTQIDLLDDYRRTVEELEAKLDDEFERAGMSDSLHKALELTLADVEKQLKALDALRSKLTQEDASHYLDRAIGAAKELRDGAKTALDNNPSKKTGSR